VADQGPDVLVEVGRPPSGDLAEAGAMREDRGLPAAGVGARLCKHAFFLRDRPDRRLLRRWIARERPDACVATLPNDHRLLLASAGDVPVVRLWFSDGESEPAPREREALLRTPLVYVFGDRPRDRLRALGLPQGRIRVLGPPLDVEATRARATDVAGARRLLGVGEDEFLFGIVARLQTHRRYEMLWEALGLLKATGAPHRLVVLGRGTYEEEVGRRPVRELGLEDHVVFGGYLKGEAYASAVAAFDAQLLLVPGSDPTCRALREGMALGVPGIATRRGLLPSMVVDGETGLLTDETAEALADTLARMARDPEGARVMGEAARRFANAHFDTRVVATSFLRELPIREPGRRTR
jgi:glycosyltransferase involved in cell wall biosynthesis